MPIGERVREQLQCRAGEIFIRIAPHQINNVSQIVSRSGATTRTIATFWVGRPDDLYYSIAELSEVSLIDTLRWKKELIDGTKQGFLQAHTEEDARYWAVAFRRLLEVDFAALSEFTFGRAALPRLEDETESFPTLRQPEDSH
jgi:hypothetical protein